MSKNNKIINPILEEIIKKKKEFFELKISLNHQEIKIGNLDSRKAYDWHVLGSDVPLLTHTPEQAFYYFRYVKPEIFNQYSNTKIYVSEIKHNPTVRWH